MERYRLEPEVAGDFGDETVLDRSVWPPRAEVFHYEFVVWFGSAIVVTSNNYAVTESLAKDFERRKFTGSQ